MIQLTLDLPFEEAMSKEDFIISGANEQAFNYIQSWPQWPANVCLLTGPSGSGKTHLSKIWAARTGAQHHRAKNLTFDLTETWLQTGALVLEDIFMPGLDEAALFHLVNMVRGGQGYLLLTAEDSNFDGKTNLPDLASRLRAATPISIGSPDDVLLRQVLVKQFSDRQILIDEKAIDYLVQRMERSLSSIRIVVDLLDKEAFSRGKAITRHLISEIMPDWEQAF